MTDYRQYTLTGDVLIDRRAWIVAGRPADHPYIIDARRRVAQHETDRRLGRLTPVQPLVVFA